MGWGSILVVLASSPKRSSRLLALRVSVCVWSEVLNVVVGRACHACVTQDGIRAGVRERCELPTSRRVRMAGHSDSGTAAECMRRPVPVSCVVKLLGRPVCPLAALAALHVELSEAPCLGTCTYV